MSYNIEIIAIKPELYSTIEKVCASLNKVQEEFTFTIPSKTVREIPFSEKRKDYESTKVIQWVKNDYKTKAGGFRPFIILVVDGRLSSSNYPNLFGNVSATDGIAVFTIVDFNHFVKDIIRFYRYYFVRYALSFLQPIIKSHQQTKNCIFDRKENKNDLKLSLNSGNICEDCYDILRPKLTPDIREAVRKMLLLVSNKHPYSLVIKGGGVKGLAFAGALAELENHFLFDSYAGTSAGAIAAVLLGAGYNSTDLLNLLQNKDFKDFKDASKLGAIYNLFKTGGLYPGKEIENWIDTLLKQKFKNKLTKIQLKDLPNHTVIYATRAKEGTIIFDSLKTREEYSVSFATRCSMSIPIFFSPKSIEDTNVFDGGVRNNFPLKLFMESYPSKQVIGLYLKTSSKSSNLTFKEKSKKLLFRFLKLTIPGLKKSSSIAGELVDIVTDGEEKQFVESNSDVVVIIDPSPIQTTDFNLTEEKKELLILSGRLGALKFIEEHYRDIEIDANKITLMNERITELRKKL